MIEVQLAMALTTVQDLGRFGYRRYGVGTAGAMDTLALQVGNLMLGNDAGAAAIEVNLFPLQIRFLDATVFAVTGADCRPALDGKPLPPWWAATAGAGQVLRLDAPVDTTCARAYLCVGGGIDVPVVLGSRSTQLRGAIGGFHGRPLSKGDVLTAAQHDGGEIDFGVPPPEALLPLARRAADTIAVRAIPASEYHEFTSAAQAGFWQTPWEVSAKSNRMGYRLAGPALASKKRIEMRSYGVVPGLVQVPPSGEPIVQMADANVSGGYPKIATVIGADLWRLGQAGPRAHVRFVETLALEAVRAADELRDYLALVQRLAERFRMDL